MEIRERFSLQSMLRVLMAQSCPPSLTACMNTSWVPIIALHFIALQRMLTVLHVAAKDGKADACRMLLRAGADCLEEMTVSLR